VGRTMALTGSGETAFSQGYCPARNVCTVFPAQ